MYIYTFNLSEQRARLYCGSVTTYFTGGWNIFH